MREPESRSDYEKTKFCDCNHTEHSLQAITFLFFSLGASKALPPRTLVRMVVSPTGSFHVFRLGVYASDSSGRRSLGNGLGS